MFTSAIATTHTIRCRGSRTFAANHVYEISTTKSPIADGLYTLWVAEVGILGIWNLSRKAPASKPLPFEENIHLKNGISFIP